MMIKQPKMYFVHVQLYEAGDTLMLISILIKRVKQTYLYVHVF